MGKDIFLSHDGCGIVTILSDDRARLFLLGLWPARCCCGNIIPHPKVQWMQSDLSAWDRK